ncbi:MAG: putative DNA-binding domain-containing protein [Rhizobiaceae bacterium]|nr:putative DNA-binding domain-containing protein [Rhizobiaceae bacterium]
MTMGFEAGQDAFARAVTDPEAALPPGVTSRRGEADAMRFAVYRNNVTVGLIRALEMRFPVARRLVGEAFFRTLARDYMRHELPASPLLFEYGDSLPAFIEGHEVSESLPYLADVTRVEAAWTRAYHARDAHPLTIAELAAIRPEDLGATRLVAHPSAALVRSAHPAGSIWAAHQSETVTPPRAWQPETVLVARPDMEVTVRILPERDAPFAQALLAGEALDAAAAKALAADATFDFGSALVGLVSLGAFSARTDDEDLPK